MLGKIRNIEIFLLIGRAHINILQQIYDYVEEFNSQFFENLSDWYIRKGPVSADKSIALALEGKVVAIPFAPEDERVQYREQARREGIVSILSIPMLLRDEIIGVLRIYTQERRDFTIDDEFFAAAAANLGAIALENARLYEAVVKDFQTLRIEMLEWRAALGHEWVAQNTMVSIDEDDAG